MRDAISMAVTLAAMYAIGRGHQTEIQRRKAAVSNHQSVRMTTNVRIVLGALLDSRTDDLWGMRIIGLTKLQSGTVYPILARLEERGWIEGRWEDEQPPGRPRRRYWRLTTWGAWRAREALGRAGGDHA